MTQIVQKSKALSTRYQFTVSGWGIMLATHNRLFQKAVYSNVAVTKTYEVVHEEERQVRNSGQHYWSTE